ncbi:MAG: 2,3-bisphosphoglycerate-independent phosphoglycerate mutase [Oscillospiraceae bacterium]|nr:2,3-bisphosphoglycerate-independent phosphoglycerate mutase [Oscillospiraceae bacterium]
MVIIMKSILLVVMDGIGFSSSGIGDAVTMANTPTLDRLLKEYPNIRLKAHGSGVGLPSDDDMGNSEVGHNALGCGQVYSQGAKLVNESIESGKLYQSAAWKKVAENVVQNDSILHFLGLLSDGNVHSNIAHLLNMLSRAKKDGIKKVRVHILLDGRDVPATSALDYIEQLEQTMSSLNDDKFDSKIASGGGRMNITMDRYQADWAMVERGWQTHVKGQGRVFATATEAIETLRGETPGIIDQDLPPFIIGENGKPNGRIIDNDSVVLFNFRGDRAIEISMAFDNAELSQFDRGGKLNVVYAGMLQYDGDLKLPGLYLVEPPEITNTLSELLVAHNIRQYAVSETQKFGHVTYFWNGNKSGKFSDALETYKEIVSDKVSFDKLPKMKSVEITDDVIAAIKSGKYDFIRCNFPNGDMVGHTGNIDATIIGVEAVDSALARLEKACEENGFLLLVTADHGNADEMLEKDKKGNLSPRTAHSLNPVPFIVCDRSFKLKSGRDYGLANVAPTIASILGIKQPDCWEESALSFAP